MGSVFLCSMGWVSRRTWSGARWLQRAAEFGQPNAMHTLGMLYRSGVGVEADPAEADAAAYKWLLLAAERYGPDEAARREAARQEAAFVAGLLADEDRARIE